MVPDLTESEGMTSPANYYTKLDHFGQTLRGGEVFVCPAC